MAFNLTLVAIVWQLIILFHDDVDDSTFYSPVDFVEMSGRLFFGFPLAN